MSRKVVYILVALAIVSGAAQLHAEEDRRVTIAIFGTDIDFAIGRLYIAGQNFSATIPPLVFLNGNVKPLTVVSFTTTTIDAVLPAGVAPGSYLLNIAIGKDVAVFECTIGYVGPQGPKGDTGRDGGAGATGPSGQPGASGPQGPKGDTGLQGSNGAVGQMGPQGPKGETGASGPVGPQGPIGAQGPAGPQTAAAVAPAMPAGVINIYAGAIPPAGYLICDGSEVSRTQYPDLFNVVQTTYGAGDGSTTFNLPDLRGRSSIGAGTGAGLSPRSIGSAVGEETHMMASNEVASHRHVVAGAVHAYGTTTNLVNPGEVGPNYSGSIGAGSNWGFVWDFSGSYTQPPVESQNQAPFNVMQPSLVLNYIIKY
jgi:microcystin-dependent protein